MATGFEFELPNELDLSEADQSQSADSGVCDVLAESTDGEAIDVVESADKAEETGTDEDDIEYEEPTVETEDPTTPASEAPVAEPAKADPPKSEMVNLVECITDAEHDCCTAESLMEDLKEQLKEAKKHYETCVKRLRTFAWELNRKAKPAQEVQPASQPIQYDFTQPVFGGLIDQPAEPTSPADESWRSVPLSDTGVQLIKGLGQKKLEALLDLCPTVGAFEDLRSKVGRDAASLPELMPKGIGQSACDSIEEMVLNWLAKRQTREAGETFVEGMAKPVGDGESQIGRRAAELNTGKANCFACLQRDDTLWKGGYRACEEGVAITECPWLPSENQDEWLRGYLAARSVSAWEGNAKDGGKDKDEPEGETDQAQVSQNEPNESETADAVPFDIDSL